MKSLAEEFEALTPAHRAEAEDTLALRARAAQLAKELGFDEGDVFHQLQQLARSPSERLRLGLAHGRLRARARYPQALMAEHFRAQLEHQGFAIVRGVVPPAELAEISFAFDRLLSTARTLPASTEVNGARFVLDAQPFRLHRVVWGGAAEPVLARYGADPRFLALAAQALGTGELVQLIQQAHFKLPHDGVDFAWHQDASNRRYGTPQWTDVDARGSFVQLALAVDPMGAENGGLRFLPGSHRAGFVADPTTGTLPLGTVDEARAIDAMLDPGDVVVFGPFVIHGSGPNTSDGTRRLFLQGYALPGANHRVYPGCGLGVPRRFDGP